MQVCITKINLHYRSLAVLAENGFQQIIFDSSIVAGLSSRPFTFFEVNMCESNMKDKISQTQSISKKPKKIENDENLYQKQYKSLQKPGGCESCSGLRFQPGQW